MKKMGLMIRKVLGEAQGRSEGDGKGGSKLQLIKSYLTTV